MVGFVVCLAVAFGVGLIVRPRWRPGGDIWGQTVVVAVFAGVFSALVGYFALDMRNADLWWVIALWALFYPAMMLGVLVRGRTPGGRPG